jgi:hypothetical protein
MSNPGEFPGPERFPDVGNFQIYPDPPKIEEGEREKERWPQDPPLSEPSEPEKQQEQS